MITFQVNRISYHSPQARLCFGNEADDPAAKEQKPEEAKQTPPKKQPQRQRRSYRPYYGGSSYRGTSKPNWRWHGGPTGDVEPE